MKSAHLKAVPANAATIPLQPASMDIWNTKYRLKAKSGIPVDENIDGTYRRIAQALAEIEATPELQEKWEERFLWALRHGAIPAGRITSNAGAHEHKPATSTINCTVSGTIHDSMNEILGKVHEAGLTLKAGCGIGYEFSTLRPKGAYVSGAGAYTSGPLSFMDIYDKMCFTVSSAGGRRGAQMATFDVGHPDVMDFVRAKREDGRLRQFNLSLLITEEFMEAVKHDDKWNLAFPMTKKEVADDKIDLSDPELIVWRDWPYSDDFIADETGKVACRIYKTIRARRLWDVIMASTYDYAEPGFILIDKVNQMNNNWFCENVRATNPCVTADTWIQTSTGPQQVETLIGTHFTARVDGDEHRSGAEGFFKTADKAVVRIQTTEGHTLRLTSDHRVRRVSAFTRYRTETEWCEAGKLTSGDRLLLNDHRANCEWDGEHNRNEGYLLGLLIGDGVVKSDKAILSVWRPAAEANGCNGTLSTGALAVMKEALTAARSLPHRSDFNGWMEVPGRNEYRLSTGALKTLAEKMGISPDHKKITPQMEQASSAFCRGLLRGLFDADGSVQGNQMEGVSLRLAQSDLSLLEAAQRMLLRLGVASTIYRNRRPQGVKSLPDGKGGMQEYNVKAQHELVISGENLQQYNCLIGFGDSDKQERLDTLLNRYQRRLNRERFTARVESVESAGFEAVYDVQIPGINTFDANGLHAHNCGEQPLPPYGACLLGSVNLTKFVHNPFTKEAHFDWDEYRDVVAVFTRMLDNVVDINGLPLPEQRKEIERKRRHGMGYLGLGSSMTMMGMKYGDPKSLEFTEQITRELALVGWRTGLEWPKRRGPPRSWRRSLPLPERCSPGAPRWWWITGRSETKSKGGFSTLNTATTCSSWLKRIPHWLRL